MQKILMSISKETIRFTYKEEPSFAIKLDKEHTTTSNEISFTKEYITIHQKIVTDFILELCKEKNIRSVSFETYELALFLLELFKKNPEIHAICIREAAPLTFSLYEKIIENKNIHYVEAESIPKYMIEMLDKKGIRSESRTEIFYPSELMQTNNLVSYSKIFYKTNIRIGTIFTEEDRDDFLAFCNINNYLKTIHLDIFNKRDLEFILDSITENRRKNINILIHVNIKDYKTIEYLKKTNKRMKKNKLHIDLVYDKEYLKNNLFPQILMNMLKICGLILVIFVVSIISYISISNYVALQEVTQIQENLKETIKEGNTENIEIENPIEKEIKNDYIVSLLPINPDVIGWLKVNNTNVDYPVVQSNDNEYYLKHNLYKETDKNGWIFMDYRNSHNFLDANTIIYGHNMYYSGVMFGTLVNAYKKTWYTNPENQIISYDTIYESNKYQIFSIYKVQKTKDYLKTYFGSDEEFNNYVDLVKGRSIHDFGIEVNPGDKILTLSTCTGENQRLVIHAKLIPES